MTMPVADLYKVKSNGALYLKIGGAVLLLLAAIGMLAAHAGGGNSADKLNKETAFLQLAASNATLGAVNGDTLYALGLQVCSILGGNGGDQAATVSELQAQTASIDQATLSELVSDAAVSLC